jgi:uncharacterized repeat protein (TIGR04138 family)
VTGQQPCEGLRDLALECWGPLALSVLRSWNITSTRDLGEMVFLLVHKQMMGKRDSDRIEDFDQVFDFNEVLGGYQVRAGSPESESEIDP